MTELASKHNARIYWANDVYYTIQLQEALTDSGTLIAFTGAVSDIFKEGDKCYIRFSSSLPLSGKPTPTVHYVLRSDYRRINQIINAVANEIARAKAGMDFLEIVARGLYSNPTYAVVAKIDKVTLCSDPDPIYSLASDEYIAVGDCIDLTLIRFSRF